MGPYSVVQCIRCLMGQPLLFGSQCWCVGERGHGDGSTGFTWLSSIALLPAAWLSSTGISHHSLLPRIPLIHLSAVNSSPHPGIAPQSWNSSPCHCAAQDMYGCGRDCLILIPFRLPQISCFTLSLKCVSSDSDSCPAVGIWPLPQFPHPPRAGPALLTLLLSPLVPSSYRVLHASVYSLPLVRFSCLLLAGVLHVLLCLKANSWCIHGERYSTSTYSPAILFSLLYLLTITSPSSWQSGLGISPLILILPFPLPLINQWPCFFIL